jgi:tRNA pseudouridine55 synthase
MARKGKEVNLKAKILVIDEIELMEYSPESITLRIVCSKGTYIRALARDIGEALSSGGHLTALRRTRVGEIKVEDCFSLEQFTEWLENQEIEDNNI